MVATKQQEENRVGFFPLVVHGGLGGRQEERQYKKGKGEEKKK